MPDKEGLSMIETRDAVTLRLPAQARYIRIARLVGAGLANELGVDLDGLDDIRLAIGEVCALATQFGAESIDLQFTLIDGHLAMRGGGRAREASGSLDGRVDDDHVKLVRQILDVACSEHEINRDENELSFSLTFTDGN